MRKRRVLVPMLMILAVLAIAAGARAQLIGVADENATMFVSPFYQRLIAPQSASQRISRYIAPYDAADGSAKNIAYLNDFINWYNHARADDVQVLVSFYHSESTPTVMPSVATYTRDVTRFIKEFPAVRTYQPWNEANRGNIPGTLASPTPGQAAAYYLALKHVCAQCTIAGLDVLDAPDIRPTIAYIHQFQHDVLDDHAALPTIWGLHNYSDTNRFSSTRTRDVLAAVKGEVWLTETGGVVQFGSNFPNQHGQGLTRAAKALSFMFTLASSNPRITRLYIFQWTGSGANARFDAGLTAANGEPRPGYYVVCDALVGDARACHEPPAARPAKSSSSLEKPKVAAAKPSVAASRPDAVARRTATTTSVADRPVAPASPMVAAARPGDSVSAKPGDGGTLVPLSLAITGGAIAPPG